MRETKEIKWEDSYLQFLDQVNERYSLETQQSYEMMNMRENLSELILFHIQEITFEENEKNPRRESFENVIGTIQEEGINFIYLILGDKKRVSFYFGIVKDTVDDVELRMTVQDMGNSLLKPAIQGNFRGSKIQKLSKEEKEDVLKKLNQAKRYGSVDGIPGINESSDKNNFQGIDRLTDVMLGDEFGLCIIAKPLEKKKIKQLENQLYTIYDHLGIYAKTSIQGGRNDSDSSATTKGSNISKTAGINETIGTSINKNASITIGKNESSSSSKGTNESESSGKNKSITTGKSVTESSGKSDSSGSSSSSSGTNSGRSVAENASKTSGENSNKTKGTSENTSLSQGISESETKSKGKTENTSKTESKSKTRGENESTSLTVSKGQSLNISKEFLNKKVQDYLKYIDEILFPMLDYGKSKGLYITNSFLFANENATLIKLGSTMRSLFSGKKGNKNSLELEILDPEDKKIEYFKNFQIPKCDSYSLTEATKNALILKSHIVNYDAIEIGNWYSASELSLIGGLPQKEIVGLSLKEEVEFGLNISKQVSEDKIELGNLIQSGSELDISVSLEKSALNKHIFITGVTGTGKTTTCQKLLLESNLPFLVIEPAKTEYRILIDKEETKDILIFTLGKDTVSPFRINPFEFFRHESITARVDMLKAAIEASFDMEAAIPQLIESAMYECYKDYGWDIATNQNYTFEDPFAEGVYSFPTLGDLLLKVEKEVEKQGFDARLKNDYIGSIKARLQGLLVGAKGLMLNVHRGINFRELIHRKVVLEIEEIKNGSEKSLIIGFILTNLCEALKAMHKETRDFKHITLIEEAHRLLSKFSPGDSMNKKQAVETFADMLAEVRKYGESLIIADQIPNKMTPEVLKNTNTKIIHKIFAEDDKEAMGNTIALSKEQKNFLSSLSTGRAIVFSQGWEKALQVQIKQSTNTTAERYVDDEELKDRNIEFYRKNYKAGIYPGTQFFKTIPSVEEFKEYVQFLNKRDFWSNFESIILSKGEKTPFNVDCWLDEYKKNIKKQGMERFIWMVMYKYYRKEVEIEKIMKIVVEEIFKNEGKDFSFIFKSLSQTEVKKLRKYMNNEKE